MKSKIKSYEEQEMSSFFDDPNEIDRLNNWLGRAPEATLILGHPGSGKTTLASSWPDTYFWSADNKIAGISLATRKRTRTFKHGEKVFEIGMSILDKLSDYDTLVKAGIKTLVVDTITSFSELMEVEILDDPILNKEGTKGLQRQHYNVISIRMQSLIRKCKEVGIDLVVVSHIDEVMAEDGTMVCHPNVTGKSQETKLGGKFDHVIYMTNDDDVYKARLKGNSRYPHAKIGTSVVIHRTAPTLVTDLSYSKLRKILSGEIKKKAKAKAK